MVPKLKATYGIDFPTLLNGWHIYKESKRENLPLGKTEWSDMRIAESREVSTLPFSTRQAGRSSKTPLCSDSKNSFLTITRTCRISKDQKNILHKT